MNQLHLPMFFPQIPLMILSHQASKTYRQCHKTLHNLRLLCQDKHYELQILLYAGYHNIQSLSVQGEKERRPRTGAVRGQTERYALSASAIGSQEATTRSIPVDFFPSWVFAGRKKPHT